MRALQHQNKIPMTPLRRKPQTLPQNVVLNYKHYIFHLISSLFNEGFDAILYSPF